MSNLNKFLLASALLTGAGTTAQAQTSSLPYRNDANLPVHMKERGVYKDVGICTQFPHNVAELADVSKVWNKEPISPDEKLAPYAALKYGNLVKVYYTSVFQNDSLETDYSAVYLDSKGDGIDGTDKVVEQQVDLSFKQADGSTVKYTSVLANRNGLSLLWMQNQEFLPDGEIQENDSGLIVDREDKRFNEAFETETVVAGWNVLYGAKIHLGSVKRLIKGLTP